MKLMIFPPSELSSVCKKSLPRMSKDSPVPLSLDKCVSLQIWIPLTLWNLLADGILPCKEHCKIMLHKGKGDDEMIKFNKSQASQWQSLLERYTIICINAQLIRAELKFIETVIIIVGFLVKARCSDSKLVWKPNQ